MLVAYGFHMVIVGQHRVPIGFPYGFHMDGHKKAPPGEGEALAIVGGLVGVFYGFDVMGGFIAYGATKGKRDPVGVESSIGRETNPLLGFPPLAPVDPLGVSLGERRERWEICERIHRVGFSDACLHA